MKVLVDACISRRVANGLRDDGHDVVWAGDSPAGTSDRFLLDVAHQENRVLITLDRDFAELVVRDKAPHCGLIRLVAVPRGLLLQISARVLRDHPAAILQRAILTVTPDRVRVRLPAVN